MASQSASPFSMLYFAPILVLAIQATFVVTPALAHFTAVTNNSYALVPRMETSFHSPPVAPYIEVHPCAKFFKAELSSFYKMHVKPLTRKVCSRMDLAAAWHRTTPSGEVECTPLWDREVPNLQEFLGQLGICFIFHQPTDGPTGHLPWVHPCEPIKMKERFVHTLSIWYTAWYGVAFDDCKQKPNAGAWKRGGKCIVFPGQHSVGDQKAPGTCFVLDKVPVESNYVEVHPCDTYFMVKNTKFYKPIVSQRENWANSEQFSFGECKEQKAAVAWFVGDKDRFTKCVPLPSEITETGLETGLCLELNTAVELRKTGQGIVGFGLEHVCQHRFESRTSTWYSRLDESMNIEKCNEQKNAGAWRQARQCYALYSSRTATLGQFPWGSQQNGECFVRDKNVALHSDIPHWLAPHKPPIVNNPFEFDGYPPHVVNSGLKAH